MPVAGAGLLSTNRHTAVCTGRLDCECSCNKDKFERFLQECFCLALQSLRKTCKPNPISIFHSPFRQGFGISPRCRPSSDNRT